MHVAGVGRHPVRARQRGTAAPAPEVGRDEGGVGSRSASAWPPAPTTGGWRYAVGGDDDLGSVAPPPHRQVAPRHRHREHLVAHGAHGGLPARAAQPRPAGRGGYGAVVPEAEERSSPLVRQADPLLEVAENALYALAGVVLVVGAAAVLVEVAYGLVTTVADGTIDAVTTALDGLLLIFILLELLAAVRATMVLSAVGGRALPDRRHHRLHQGDRRHRPQGRHRRRRRSTTP